MNTEDMPKFAIVLFALAAIVLISMALIGVYGKALRTNTSATVNNVTVLLGTNVAIGTANQYPFLQTVTNCVNVSNGSLALDSTYYTVNEGTAAGGSITLLTAGAAFNNTGVNCSITYLATTTGSTTAASFITGIGYFGLFAGVLVLSIVGVIITNVYRGRKDGRR